jgi:DNA processing protein
MLASRHRLWPLLANAGFRPQADLFHSLRAAGVTAEAAFRALAEPAWQDTTPRSGCLRAGEPHWPERLGTEKGAPVVLTFEGDRTLLDVPGVAIVGARNCTPYGRRQAGQLARSVADAGGVVVSGLARGIDSAAHEAAHGRTIAVLGQGLRAPMAAWQRRIRDSILDAGGLVLSELGPHTHADVMTFPVRNRIIAGLARAVVVVEAGVHSGSRNTARHALDAGREVLAVPGPLDAPASAGCLDLIEEGATVVRSAETVLRVAGLPMGPNPAPEGPLVPLLAQPRTPEELVDATGLGWAEVMAQLGVLELTGRAIRLPGRRYEVRRR